MKLRLQFGGVLIALAISVAMALPCAAQKPETKRTPQNREANRPPRQQQGQAPRQERRQPPEARKPQHERQNVERPNNARPNRATESISTPNAGNRPPNVRGESERPNFNPNRPPNAGNSPAKRFQDLSPADRQRVLQNREKFDRLPPQKQQEMREAARNWQRLTPNQQSHIKNDVLPQWKQMSPNRQRAIRQRLGVLQNMPESARNQHLNDPNFTRGMSEEDKAMLRDLSHMHVGAPDPPGE